MQINIGTLTEAELLDLNRRIVARLRLLNEIRTHEGMLAFRIGDRVAFQPTGQGSVVGMVTRYNRKTVTVISDDGRQWNVSPGLLSKVSPVDVSPVDATDARTAPTAGSNVVQLGKR